MVLKVTLNGGSQFVVQVIRNKTGHLFASLGIRYSLPSV
jgi:hypothetical protein